jgi:hypothetical protein
MNQLKLLLGALAIILFWSSCEEEPIIIPELKVGERKVVVEELTGVRCPNCPDGTQELVALGNQFGENLIVVGIHAAPGYDNPYPENLYDFRTTAGTEMANFIGQASFFPTASINRRLVPPETEVYLGRAAWAGIISEELAEDPQIGVFIDPTFDPATRKLEVKVNLTPGEDLTGEHRITVLITQDSIVDYQKVGPVKQSDYIHRHVLRDVITQATGDVISDALTGGSLIQKLYSYTLPEEWDEHHCSVVAFVHHGTDPDKRILQADEKHLD